MVEEEDTVNEFPIPPVVIEHFKKSSPHLTTIEDLLRVNLDSSEDENKTSAWLHPGSAMTQKMNCLDSFFKIKSPSQKPAKHKTEQESNPPEVGTSGSKSPQTPTVLHSISDEADTSDSTSDSSESKIPVTSHNVAKSTTAHSQSHAKGSEQGSVIEDCDKSQSHNGPDYDNSKTALSKMESPSRSDSFRVKESTSEKSQLIESLLFNAANKLTPKSLTSNFQKNQIVSSTPKLHSTPGGEALDETLGSAFQSTGLETDLNSTLLGTSALDKINFDDPNTCKGIVFSEDLKEDDEIYIVQCPKELDIRLLKGKRISLKGESGLQLQTGDSIQKYEALASEETLQRNVNLILPSQTARSFKLVTLPLAGSILMTEDAEIPTIEEEEEESHFHEKSKIALPKGLKERHPLLGRDYQAVTKATPSLNFMLSKVKTEKDSKNESELNTESGDNAKKKKTKKTKTDSISMELTELKSPKKEVSEAPALQKTIPEPTPIVKKKKSKHSFYDQLAVQNLTASLSLELSQIKSDKSEQLNSESKDKKKKKKKKKKKAEHQETEPEIPPTKKKKKSKRFFDQPTVINLTNSLSAELSQMKSESVEKNESEVLNTESRDKEKKKKKKKKEKADADPELAPTKKKKKSKHSFDQQSIKDLTESLMLEVPKVKSENDANGNEFVNTESRHKSKKKKRKADFDDSQTSSFHDSNQSDLTRKKKKRKHMSEEI